TVKGFYAVHRIPLDSIEYAEAQNKQIVFTLQDGTEIKTGEPLHILENKLLAEYGFFRCHRSYIVNINHISTYTNKEITMSSGCRIPISRSCQKNFESAYFQFIFGSAGE
ncbi:MAG: LytTR family transcriptional regulator DNA-binding domain-containing protein, partial [Oscillospiraceae bacterium]|nr:LytTR family transcriptional regulator DNA-binding domain-containing protein [Oscillospiraceae bacterium]